MTLFLTKSVKSPVSICVLHFVSIYNAASVNNKQGLNYSVYWITVIQKKKHRDIFLRDAIKVPFGVGFRKFCKINFKRRLLF